MLVMVLEWSFYYKPIIENVVNDCCHCCLYYSSIDLTIHNNLVATVILVLIPK